MSVGPEGLSPQLRGEINLVLEEQRENFLFAEAVENWSSQGLGRTMTRLSKGRMEKVGIILPLNADQRSHVVVLNNATVMILEPGTEAGRRGKYRKLLSPFQRPLEWRVDRYSDIEAIEKKIEEGIRFGSRLLHRRNPKDKLSRQKTNQAILQGVAVAKDLRNGRTEALIQANYPSWMIDRDFSPEFYDIKWRG